MALNILKYIGKAALKGIALLFFISVVVFTLVNLSPIDPVSAYLGSHDGGVSPEQRQEIIEYWGLGKPMLERYGIWLSSVVFRGDWGMSSIYRQPVIKVVRELFKASLTLMGVSWLLSGLLSFALGVVAAVKKGTWIDKVIKAVCITLASTPSFWVGMVLILIFAVWLGVLPSSLSSPATKLAADVTLWDRVRHLILPVIALSVNGMGYIVLHTREKLIKSFESDYSLFAKARGEKKWSIIRRHNIRNVLLPAITLQFASISELFGGSAFVETVFSYPGLAQAAVSAGLRSDVQLLAAIAIFATIFVYVGNLMADVLYAIVDPQIREGYHA
jgi:peptide/nickel transport system permease protein